MTPGVLFGREFFSIACLFGFCVPRFQCGLLRNEQVTTGRSVNLVVGLLWPEALVSPDRITMSAATTLSTGALPLTALAAGSLRAYAPPETRPVDPTANEANLQRAAEPVARTRNTSFSRNARGVEINVPIESAPVPPPYDAKKSLEEQAQSIAALVSRYQAVQDRIEKFLRFQRPPEGSGGTGGVAVSVDPEGSPSTISFFDVKSPQRAPSAFVEASAPASALDVVA